MMGPEALQDKHGRSAFRPTKQCQKSHRTPRLGHNGAKLVLSWPKLGEVWQGLHFLIGAGAMFGAAFGQDMEKKPKMR